MSLLGTLETPLTRLPNRSNREIPLKGASYRNLDKIEHIVVLMMENRSFDQVLGYLQGEGLDVEGLESAKRAKPNPDRAGNEYPPFAWEPGQTVPPVPPGHKAKILDPCHGPGCVHAQLEGGNAGFVTDFEKTRIDENGKPVQLAPESLRVPMGHYTAEHLPAYDYLAKNFCVCDHWHASIPGDTWPNRLYALAGREAPRIGHKPGLWERLLRSLRGLPGARGLENAPIFEVEAFTRQLHDSQWRWYSHDPATLRAADKLYRDFVSPKRENFAYFDRKRLSLETRMAESVIVGHDSFLDDAAKGQLRDVSWIDPNFIDLKVLDPNSNDDHPPSDIKAGQALVMEVFEALRASPNWNDTMLVVVYDEHGGFYDHVTPPAVPAGDASGYPTYGVRVPALVAGPRVKQHVCHETFEHTSLIATILRRFASNPEHALAAMPKRVQEAPHLGVVLEAEPRTNIGNHGDVREQLKDWRAAAREQRQAPAGGNSEALDGTGHGLDLHEFQEEFVHFALAMRDAGLPAGQP